MKKEDLSISTALLLVLCPFFCSGCGDPSPTLVVSGRIEVDDVHVGSKIGGRVAEVRFEEGEEVEAGRPVVLLEDEELLAQLREAKASLARAQSELDLLLAGAREEEISRAEAIEQARRSELELRRKGFRKEEVREAEAQVVSAKSDLELASREFTRAAALYQGGAVDERTYDNRKSALETARARLEIALQRQSLFQSGSRPEEIAMAESRLSEARAELERLRNGPRPEEISAQRAAVQAAEANVARLEVQLEETRILAPCDAFVETLELEPGDLVKAGETVSVLNLKNRPWVRCYVPENRLGWVQPGDRVEVTVDSYPGETFKGVVRYINSEAEFTPRNVQTTEKRSELVFEMKVDILEGGDRLRAGMYADVRIGSAT